MRARWLFMIPSIAAIALSAMLAAPVRAPVLADDMDSYRIICTDQRGRIVFNIPVAYRVSIDPTGTIYSYTTDWLSDRVLTFVKGGDTSCLIASNRS
jgi:hypothetical protein